MGIKSIPVLCIFLILTNLFAFAANNRNGVRKMDENILKRRFGEFSTSGAFILAKIQNTQTKDSMEIICENAAWAFTCVNTLKLMASFKEYTDYMVKNYDKTFEVPDEIYSALKGSKAGDSYMKYAQTNWGEVKAEFLAKERGFYNIKDRKLERNPDFIKMLLLHNVVVRQDCIDGSVYVQE